MYRLIIVNNDFNMQKMLTYDINWENLNLELVGLCTDGIEAFHMIVNETPDIVLMSITLPSLSGLDLIQVLQAHHLHTEFVILSDCHSFSLVTKAMLFGIQYFLLTPCCPLEICTIMKEAVHKCISKKKEKYSTCKHSYLYALYKDNILCNMIISALSHTQSLESLLSYFTPYIDMECTSFVQYHFLNLTNEQLVFILLKLTAYFDTPLMKRPIFELYSQNQLTLFFKTDYRTPLIEENLKRFLGLLNALPNGNHIITHTLHQHSLPKLLSYLLISFNDTDTLYLVHSNIKYSIHSKTKVSPMIEPSIAGLKSSIKCKQFIEEVLDYIHLNYANPKLTLKWIATQYLYMNADYVSKQFSKQVGMKFSNYLTQLRVEKAKALLLQEGSEHIYKVAQLTGFGHNPQYFTQIFKKYTGLSPTKFIAIYQKQKTSINSTIMKNKADSYLAVSSSI